MKPFVENMNTVIKSFTKCPVKWLQKKNIF